MAKFQTKITNYTKNWEDHSLNEKRQSIHANPEKTEMLELTNKYFKAVTEKQCFNEQLWIFFKHILKNSVKK